MDSLPDDEIIDIWDRVKTYLDLTKFEIKDRQSLISSFEDQIKQAPSPKRQGSTDTLIEHEFPERAIEISQISSEILGERVVFTKKYSFRGKDSVMAFQKIDGKVRILTWGTYDSLGVSRIGDAKDVLLERLEERLESE